MDSNQKIRSQNYFHLSNLLAHVDNEQLPVLLGGDGVMSGWGGTHVFKLGGSKVFVKRIPLTEVEHENYFCTKNLFELPTFYNYGVGSAGFGAFRELVSHIKTTNWVLEGLCANFPLMYHYRIIAHKGGRTELDEERHKGYVKYWNSDTHIDQYIRQRSAARYEIILFLEYFPHVLYKWLPTNTRNWETIAGEMMQAIRFLRSNGVIHFDAHFANIVVDDGGIPYLTDYGLVLDKAFGLTPHERDFFRRNVDYDLAQFLSGIGSWSCQIYWQLPKRAKARLSRTYEIGTELEYHQLLALLVSNITEIYEDGLMPLDDCYVSLVANHRDLITTMDKFYMEMRRNESKDARFQHTKIRRLLTNAGVLEP